MDEEKKSKEKEHIRFGPYGECGKDRIVEKQARH
jgi:hypothetical protein